LSLAGSARRISTGELSPFTGVLTAQFNVLYQSVLGTLLTGGTVRTSYSGTFTAIAEVPEPQTIALVLGGILVLAGIGMRTLSRRTR
jgi:hypothetical protein